MAASIVIAAYRPRPGHEGELLALVRDHVPRLRAIGLVTERAPTVMATADGTILEVFEWSSEDAIARAHEHPVVHALWAEFEACCWYETPSNLPELQRMFVSLTPL